MLAASSLRGDKFHADMIDYLTVLLAERVGEQARISRIKIEGNCYADTVGAYSRRSTSDGGIVPMRRCSARPRTKGYRTGPRNS